MKITVLDRCTITTGDVSLAPLDAVGEVTYYDLLPHEQIADAIADSDAVIVNKARITDEIMEQCKNLRFIGLFATGYNNIDTKAAAKRGIVVCNVPGYSTDSVAQHTFALMLHFASRADDYAASVANGDWANAKAFSYLAFPTSELCGKTLAIFGFGTIGKAVAKIGQAFGMKVIASVRRPQSYDGVEFVSVDELFARADYLSLHCPLTEETQHFVNRDTLAKMKPSAVIINTARGGVIEEEALTEALNSGMIRGAGIDVLDTEPMRPNHPYLTAKNCYITPHVAWASIEARSRLIGLVAENLKAFQNGKPINQVN
ncbi:MAG: D-2-hydroxyacid dehydrogenase [Clostridia bacterium]|nr:D-2-hydroxyacid dehydrogenase [Clostridia bacterium]